MAKAGETRLRRNKELFGIRRKVGHLVHLKAEGFTCTGVKPDGTPCDRSDCNEFAGVRFVSLRELVPAKPLSAAETAGEQDNYRQVASRLGCLLGAGRPNNDSVLAVAPGSSADTLAGCRQSL